MRFLGGAHERGEGLPAGLRQAAALVHGGKQAAALALAKLHTYSRRIIYICCSERFLQRHWFSTCCSDMYELA